MIRSVPALTLLSILCTSGAVSAQVSGVVKDKASGLPVADALVTVQAKGIRAQTDASGNFSLSGASGSGLVIVAAKQGFYNSGVNADAPATNLNIELEGVDLTPDPNHVFDSPGSCGVCHTDQYAEWAKSPMKHAGENTWVYDIYDGSGTSYGTGGFVYTRDSVHAAKFPESDCASCHQPEPWIKQPYIAMEPLSALSDEAKNGVSCVVCHQMANVDGTKPNFPGVYPGVVTMARPAVSAPVVFGLLGDATFVQGSMRPAYQPQLAALVCATCHQDKNDPDGDGDFEEADGVISEPTYLEWLNSPYSDPKSPRHATCVTCHMKATGAAQACNQITPPLGRPNGEVRAHNFPGTTPEFLENAVSLGLEAKVEGQTVTATVTLENDLTGHHVPTGVTIRNMILLVEAWRAQDDKKLTFVGTQKIHDLGGVGDPAQGYYAGLPGKLYAKINEDATGKGPTFFTDAVKITADNRLAPLEKDTTSYSFELPADGGELHVRARVIYRRSWRALTDAKKWTEDGHGKPLADVQAPYFGHLMEEAERTIDLPFDCDAGQCPDAGTDAGAGGSSAKPASDDGGCGCRSTRSKRAPGPWLFLILLAALRRRRRAP